MAPKRNSSGMFIKKEDELPSSKYWNYTTVLIIVILFIVVSPWIYIIIKKNFLGGMSDSLSEFYERNFSCVNITTLSEQTNGKEQIKSSL